jgi:hypothetical protein
VSTKLADITKTDDQKTAKEKVESSYQISLSQIKELNKSICIETQAEYCNFLQYCNQFDSLSTDEPLKSSGGCGTSVPLCIAYNMYGSWHPTASTETRAPLSPKSKYMKVEGTLIMVCRNWMHILMIEKRSSKQRQLMYNSSYAIHFKTWASPKPGNNRLKPSSNYQNEGIRYV